MTHLAAVFRQAELDAVRYGMLSEFAFSRRGRRQGRGSRQGMSVSIPRSLALKERSEFCRLSHESKLSK